MKIIVGMSGGVDSTIAAYILKKEGHEVIGVYFDFLNEKKEKSFKIDDSNKDLCDTFKNLYDISRKLSIDIYYKNYKEEFDKSVVNYFITEYKNGNTPNPCAFCNGTMKFKKLYDMMNETKCEKIATGHYANVEYKNGRYCIKKSANLQKDQSYMLYTLDQMILRDLIFPIGNMQKDEVRNIAKVLNLYVASVRDSQDVCFINGDYTEFIKEYDFGKDYKEKISSGKLSKKEISEKNYLKKGEFVDKSGKILGFHDGIINYTIGQRKGLNIAFGERKFVLDIDAENRKVVLGENKDLMSKDFDLKDIVWQLYDEKKVLEKFVDRGIIGRIFGEKLLCKVRYRHKEEACTIKKGMHFHFKNAVRAITRGQAAVFYNKYGEILFGGTIKCFFILCFCFATLFNFSSCRKPDVPEITKIVDEPAILTKEIFLDISAPFATFSVINEGCATIYYHNEHLDEVKKKRKVVAVNAGHGTKGGSKYKTYSHPDFTPKVSGGTNAKGAVMSSAISGGTTLKGGIPESEVNLKVAKLLKEKLLASDYNVLMLRENDDQRLDNIARTVIANENADIHIAIHFDSTTNDKGIFYITPARFDSYINMEPLKSNVDRIEKLGDSIIAAFRDMGEKIFGGDGTMRGDLTQLSFSTNASIDIELGDKKTDISDEHLDIFAEGIKQGIDRYFGKY